MTTTSQDWALGVTLLILAIIIMSAYAALLWSVLGSQ